ncbi:hypothetical protein EYD45_15835 [Hyunsoonleella flava]|uniref:Uncharacterized protein n=1 Tax=Hyunsoonleella flava TaxID=2527939 RepID=A0A4Q9FD58_9FLAO|nr:hypothetical protein [Hyunsoonleella flava]TBM98986.1 hypothetical protein EYD45_15835 [Hyunsoonleella flava]
MKNIVRFLLLIVFVTIGMSLSAQEIKVNDKVYEVKKGLIFQEGVDITNTLSVEEKAKILAEFEKKQQNIAEAEATQKRIEKAEKEQKKAEKEQRKAEKKRKKAEKALRQKEKAQSNYDKATKKFKDAQKKYEKLKSKGKLSPQDEKKWLEKIEKLNANVAKTKQKLK